jgi:hypothetical protein
MRGTGPGAPGVRPHLSCKQGNTRYFNIHCFRAVLGIGQGHGSRARKRTGIETEVKSPCGTRGAMLNTKRTLDRAPMQHIGRTFDFAIITYGSQGG